MIKYLVLLLMVSATQASAQTKYIVSGEGNSARYRVTEELADLDFPNDAVGETPVITGSIMLDRDGRVVSASSRINIDVRALKSDREHRDDYVQDRLLETARFPFVSFAPVAIRAASGPLPKSGMAQIHVTGNLTVKGVTRMTTWTGRAVISDKGVTGRISTTFTFADFGLKKPSAMMVLSVEDDITLEYDFSFVKAP